MECFHFKHYVLLYRVKSRKTHNDHIYAYFYIAAVYNVLVTKNKN